MKGRPLLLWVSLLGGIASFALSAEQPDIVIAIKDAHIIPVVGEDIPRGTIIVKGSRIEAVGKDVPIPTGAKIVDAAGLYAYPGMIDGCSTLGLTEIGAVAATNDSRETGRINPQVRAVEALRPDSMHIAITRANGITAALVVPGGGLIAGQSGLIRLIGWTPAEMIIRSPVAMQIVFSALGRSGMRRGGTPREEASKQILELKDWLNKARYYQKRKTAAEKNSLLALPDFDETLECLLPIVDGDLPLMISVQAEKDIRAAIKFIQEEKLKAIFLGAHQGWKVAAEIASAGIPVVFGSLYDLPPNWEDGYDSLYTNPALLRRAGVKIAFSSQSASSAKDLPYHAAKAAAFGLDRREALKAVTIYPAEIFGVSDLMGSLEKGKLANIVLADDDLLELRTNIKQVFIDGQEVDLANRWTELLDKFKKRNNEK
jgi:imidazolonepropionase-like amidohydrolase